MILWLSAFGISFRCHLREIPMALSGHRNIVAWQRGMDLSVNAYAFGRSLRPLRHGAIASQLERAAISIPINVAEGRGREKPGEFPRYLSIAMGSLREVETLLEITDRVGAGKKESILALRAQADEVGRVLFGLRRVAERARENARKPMPRADS